MRTYRGNRLTSRSTGDEVDTTGIPSRWERKVFSLLNEGEEAGELVTVLRALLYGAGIVITKWSPDAERDTLLAMLYLSETAGLTQPGSWMH